MDPLPPELLLQVFDYLDGPAPSDTRLHDLPTIDLLTSGPGYSQRPLKAISRVSRLWRSLVLPCLFRHVVWMPEVYSLTAFTLNPRPLLRFLADNNLAHYVATLALVIEFYDPAARNLMISPKICPDDLEWLWDRIFSVIDPVRFTILARPTTLAALTSSVIDLNDAWVFDTPYHILSFARVPHRERTESDGPSGSASADARPAVQTVSSTLPAVAFSSSRSRTPLFTIRPWTSILLNEGSSAKVYRVYEFYTHTPPSILSALLGTEEYADPGPLIPKTVVDFNYIAVFPLATHFSNLVDYLPRIDRLFVQLSPRPGNKILEDRQEMRRINPDDLWLERDDSYTHLMRQLTQRDNPQTNWNLLQVFESGDAVDQETWGMLVAYLGKVIQHNNWRVERQGVFSRISQNGESIT
ncbi:hypothetical protein GQX73_g10392 [Xylaria multiplex]|uniref:Uncharacterized protein n=1 Tax=Xylaria multiplex TaxID=323545 RepID=A0A7C8MIA2_9PEZI|nr:hypothetical protein GQX73_g10392 [Xylaria multiplex]